MSYFDDFPSDTPPLRYNVGPPNVMERWFRFTPLEYYSYSYSYSYSYTMVYKLQYYNYSYRYHKPTITSTYNYNL